MNTTTRIPEGQRVLYIGGGEENNGSLIGQFGYIERDDKTNHIPYYVRFDDAPGYTRWWCPREALVAVPSVGDKVIPVNGDRVGIPEEYRDKVGTVASVHHNEGNREHPVRVAAEFPSHQKPDDTIRWTMNEWKPADGHTLTVSDYRPTVGDRVEITGYLADTGIIDTVRHDGSILAVDGDIWTVQSVRYGRQVSGPGYVYFVAAGSNLETDVVEEPMVPKHELDRANERVAELRERASKWERDFMRYAERVLEEAVDRDWCSEYERVIDDIRGSLEIATIPEREEERDFYWEETYTVTVRRYGSATFKAGADSDDLDNEAREQNNNGDATRDEIIDAVRNGEYASEEYVDGSAEWN